MFRQIANLNSAKRSDMVNQEGRRITDDSMETGRIDISKHDGQFAINERSGYTLFDIDPHLIAPPG
ncbi:hypothetical protein C5Y93_22070 [Blastopirellula marina]|uniref:Uncharacterized protein n=1 Tax=Blastopirellula marina TaxID=124 RepID=A0A2S8GIL7_9BACT|nr:hypothetical protein C5Y93_22070 [Blastopirellula marina]